MEMKKRIIVQEKIISGCVEASMRKSQARFQIIRLMLGKAWHENKKSENLPEISLSRTQHHHRLYLVLAVIPNKGTIHSK